MPLPASVTNVLPKLPKAKWRDLDFPIFDAADASGGHNQAERIYPYIPGAGHDNVNRAAIQMPFKLYFLNSLRPKMFPDLFNDWEQEFIFNGSIGVLQHPVLGKVDARPLTWNIEASADRVSGVIMDVTFVESIRDVDDLPHFNLSAPVLADLAASSDADMEALGIKYPTGERTTSLSDLIGQIRGLIFSTRLTIEGVINQALGLIDRIVDTVESLPQAINGIVTTTAHFGQSLVFKLKSLRNSVKDLGRTLGVNTARPIARRRTNGKTTVPELAAELKNSVSDLVVLNPGLMSEPGVRAGKLITYYAS